MLLDNSKMKNLGWFAAILVAAGTLWAQSASQNGSTNTQAREGRQQPAPEAKPEEKRVRAAKTQEEYAAYQAAANQQDFAKADAAATEFATKFPDSDLRSVLFEGLMRRYQEANNAEKTLDMGHKVLMLDADSVFALIIVSSVLAERTSESDTQMQQRRAEVMKDSGRAIELIDSGAFKPAQFTSDQLNGIKAIAYAAQGTVELAGKNDKAAEDLLRKATELGTLNPESSVWLRLALALDHQKKYDDALVAANRAVELAATEPDVLKLATQEQTRLKQLVNASATH